LRRGRDGCDARDAVSRLFARARLVERATLQPLTLPTLRGPSVGHRSGGASRGIGGPLSCSSRRGRSRARP
jgi:hypothetical protein